MKTFLIMSLANLIVVLIYLVFVVVDSFRRLFAWLRSEKTHHAT